MNTFLFIPIHVFYISHPMISVMIMYVGERERNRNKTSQLNCAYFVDREVAEV
jgi:hypothetical protein